MARYRRLYPLFLLLVVGTARAQNLTDDFTSFDTNVWTTAPYLDGLGALYSGFPQTLSPTTLDGNSVVRMTSIMGNFIRRGFGSSQSFSAPAGSLTVDFKTMPFHDGGVPAANQSNIDGLLEVWLMNPIDKRFLTMAIDAPFFGDPTHRLAGFESSFGGGSSAVVVWDYDTYYRLALTSDGVTTHMSFRNSTDQELLGQSFNFGLDALGAYKIVLSQQMGTPNAEYYSDVSLDRLVFIGVPEPSSLLLCGLAATGLVLVMRNQIHRRKIPC